MKRFTDGSCQVSLLGEDDPHLKYASTWEAQAFISHWYADPMRVP